MTVNITLPTVGADSGTWGDELNAIIAAVVAAYNAHETQTTAAHGGIVADSDARLTNAREPLPHASTHLSTGSDPLPYTQPADVDAQIAAALASLSLLNF